MARPCAAGWEPDRNPIVQAKALAAFLSNEPEPMSAEDAKLATYRLSRFIREQERVLEARK